MSNQCKAPMITWIGIVLFSMTAGANGTHKRRMTSELDASVTCTRSDSTTVRLHVLADDLVHWLPREDGGYIVVQELKEITVNSINLRSHLASATITFLNGDTEAEILKIAPLPGTDRHNQDKTMTLAQCKRIAIVATVPVSENSKVEQTAK